MCDDLKKITETKDAPAAIGPYSQAVRYGNLLFISGQIPLNPATNEIETEIVKATDQVLDNIEAILKHNSCTFDNVLKTTIFLQNLENFSIVNEIYQKRFPKNPPARSTIEVSRLPKDVEIEIEAIAICE